MPQSIKTVIVDGEQLHLLKIGRQYLETAISKEKSKNLNININDISIAARNKWSDYVYYIHCNRVQTEQVSITKQIWLQILKNTNAAAGGGGELETPIKVQKDGKIHLVPLPTFNGSSPVPAKKPQTMKRKEPEDAVEFSWPVTGMEDFDREVADECHVEHMPSKKPKKPAPPPSSPSPPPPEPAVDLKATSGYRKAAADFLKVIKTGKDVPPRLREMATFFEGFANPEKPILDKTVFGTGAITKDALRETSEKTPDVPFNKALGFNVSLWSTVFHSPAYVPPAPPKPKPAPKPKADLFDNMF